VVIADVLAREQGPARYGFKNLSLPQFAGHFFSCRPLIGRLKASGWWSFADFSESAVTVGGYPINPLKLLAQSHTTL
jgi:hypothetical protein